MIFISIGPTCYTSFLLREVGYRFDAFPFDWLFSSLEVIEDCIRDNFASFLNPAYYYDISGTSMRHRKYDGLLDTPNLWEHHVEHGGVGRGAYGPNTGDNPVPWKMFNHHVLTDSETYEAFKRRCSRFMDAMNGNEDVCLVYYNRNTNNCEEIVDFARRMSFRDGVTVLGIIESKAYPECTILHADSGIIVAGGADAYSTFRIVVEEMVSAAV